MVENSKQLIKERLEQIANALLLNGTLVESPGIICGKLGLAIFFFHYARYTENLLFADYAMDLIDKMQNQIHVNTSADYEKGIAGIGVGINYLIQNKFLLVEGDVCEDLDERMFRAVMYDPWFGYSLYDGLIGYGRYWISRLPYQKVEKQAMICLEQIISLIEKNISSIPVGEQTDVYCFLSDLQKIHGFEKKINLLECCWTWKDKDSFSRLGDSMQGCAVRNIQCKRYFYKIYENDFDINETPKTMGLLNGYAGAGLFLLEMLYDTNYSWAFLL